LQVWDNDLERRARRRLRISCRTPFLAIQDSEQNSNIARLSEGNFVRDIQTWYSEISSSSFFADYNTNYGICFPEENCYHATTVSTSVFFLTLVNPRYMLRILVVFTLLGVYNWACQF